jgi:hypothetical protein
MWISVFFGNNLVPPQSAAQRVFWANFQWFFK